MGGGKKATDDDGATGGEGAAGGGADGEGEPPASSLVPEVLCEYMKIPATGTEVTVMAKIRATVHQDESRRASISICAAVDRSGSMKDHLPLLKETLQFMVQQLRPEDKLSVITFDHEGYEFDVFLSFAEEERDFVERVLLLPLRQRGYSVFWHHEHFVPGYDIGELIHNAIHSCRRIILVCTANFTRSSFCLLELRYSLARQCTEGKRCIIPIVFENNLQCCPRELQGVNQVRLADQHLNEDDIDDLVDRLALGEPLEPVDGRQQREPIQWINDVL